jgi:TusA-related sulfurtransferase
MRPEGRTRVPAVVVDARNVPCPVPVLRAALAIRDLTAGETIEVVTTDRVAHVDIPAWASDMGHLILDTFEQDGEIHFIIEKSG